MYYTSNPMFLNSKSRIIYKVVSELFVKLISVVTLEIAAVYSIIDSYNVIWQLPKPTQTD